MDVPDDTYGAELELETHALLCHVHCRDLPTVAEQRDSIGHDSSVATVLEESLDVALVFEVHDSERHIEVVAIAVASDESDNYAPYLSFLEWMPLKPIKGKI